MGLAALNGGFHRLTGVRLSLYILTDWMGLVPVGIGLGFACLGLVQWVQRKSLKKVDFSILALGIFYAAVIGAYLFFESEAVNYRPILIGGILETSYPSSSTLLALCVMPTAMMQLRARIKPQALRRWILFILALFTGIMVVGRLLCGVHWLSDIIGGGLLSAGLVLLYAYVCRLSE